MRNSLAAFSGALMISRATTVAGAAGIQGDYVEARTADVFTGPCISNAEVFITGNQAVMAWKVNQGAWQGADLSGLCVAAAVRGTTTFSARPAREGGGRADRRREGHRGPARGPDQDGPGARRRPAAQRGRGEDRADQPEAREPRRLRGRRRPTPPTACPTPPGPRSGPPAWPRSSPVPLDENDHFCGNEVVAYPPLSQASRPCPPTPSATSSRAKGWTPAGTTPTAGAASSAISPSEPRRPGIAVAGSTPTILVNAGARLSSRRRLSPALVLLIQ